MVFQVRLLADLHLLLRHIFAPPRPWGPSTWCRNLMRNLVIRRMTFLRSSSIINGRICANRANFARLTRCHFVCFAENNFGSADIRLKSTDNQSPHATFPGIQPRGCSLKKNPRTLPPKKIQKIRKKIQKTQGFFSEDLKSVYLIWSEKLLKFNV